ncbi:MAG TPA: hypothetical protein VFB63_28970 [Bryobacteraceae bacterium]|jgi:hypothetical protein|nr:hypothetical protein [Bryobacteraceae bacterium]
MVRSTLLLACCLAACLVFAQDPKKTARILTGDAKGPAANNPVCKLFTKAEAAKYIGKPVGEISNAAMGSGCQWPAQDDAGDMMVQIVPKSYHEEPKSAKGYKKLPDVGTNGFVSPFMDGWKAAAIRGEDSINVTLAGPNANEKTTTELLKETLLRKK